MEDWFKANWDVLPAAKKHASLVTSHHHEVVGSRCSLMWYISSVVVTLESWRMSWHMDTDVGMCDIG